MILLLTHKMLNFDAKYADSTAQILTTLINKVEFYLEGALRLAKVETRCGSLSTLGQADRAPSLPLLRPTYNLGSYTLDMNARDTHESYLSYYMPGQLTS